MKKSDVFGILGVLQTIVILLFFKNIYAKLKLWRPDLVFSLLISNANNSVGVARTWFYIWWLDFLKKIINESLIDIDHLLVKLEFDLSIAQSIGDKIISDQNDGGSILKTECISFISYYSFHSKQILCTMNTLCILFIIVWFILF